MKSTAGTLSGWIQPVEHVLGVWVVSARGVGGRDAVVKPT